MTYDAVLFPDSLHSTMTLCQGVGANITDYSLEIEIDDLHHPFHAYDLATSSSDDRPMTAMTHQNPLLDKS